MEVIVVDDGSTDQTAAIVKSHDGLTYIFQKNSGPSSARNTGIKRASGLYLSFLGADDLWAKEKISTQFKFLLSNPRYDFVFAHKEFIVEEGVVHPPWYKNEFSAAPTPLLSSGAMLAKKEVFNIIGGYNEEMRYGENAEWLIRAKEANLKYKVLPQSLVTLRIHSSNMTNHLTEMRKSILDTLKKSLDRRRKSSRNR